MTAGLERLSIHQFARIDLAVDVFLRACAAAGAPAVALLRTQVAPFGVERTATLLAEVGLQVSSYSAVGYWTTGHTPEGMPFGRDEILRQLDAAVCLGAPVVIIVAGGLDLTTKDLAEGWRRTAEGILDIVPAATERGLRLAVEPLHPILAPQRSVVVSLEHALELITPAPAERVGIALDAWHVWWEPKLDELIRAAGERIFCVHVDDFVLPLPANFRRRGLPGEGCIDLPRFKRAVEATGFGGYYEVEVTNEVIAELSPEAAMRRIVDSYREFIG
jgi:sugar phosphate isomerase/epimerase